MSGYEIYRDTGLALGSGKWRPLRVCSVGSGGDKVITKTGIELHCTAGTVHFGIVYRRGV